MAVYVLVFGGFTCVGYAVPETCESFEDDIATKFQVSVTRDVSRDLRGLAVGGACFVQGILLVMSAAGYRGSEQTRVFICPVPNSLAFSSVDGVDHALPLLFERRIYAHGVCGPSLRTPSSETHLRGRQG